MTARRLGQVLESRGVDGLLIPTLKWRGDANREIDWTKFAAAYLDTTKEFPALSAVTPAYAENVRVALDHLRTLGFRRIGFWLSSFVDDITEHSYSATYLHERIRHGFPQIPLPDLETPPGVRLADWLAEHRPDAILCNEATMVEDLAKLGTRVPEDVSVAHLNLREDVEGWAGVTQRHELIGASVVDIVVAQLHRGERGIPQVDKHISIRGQWRDGWTCLRKAEKMPARSKHADSVSG
jgi:LacI family transcriptional regulator